ncbi:hypothetical protein CY652_12880 [Burkholderia sp. WAC0059]|nr:hypothetical protein CY652_12880 [Burkholderia sp. WAC0059]
MPAHGAEHGEEDSGPSAEALCRAGRFAEALTRVTPALDASADVPQPARLHALNIAAVCLLGLGRIGDAEACWRRAIGLDAGFADAYCHLGTMLKGLGRLADAETLYRQWAALCPDRAEAHNNHGAVLQELGRRDEAEAAYARALAIRPDYVEARYNLGLALQAARRLPEAEAAYHRVLALHPAHAESHNNLGNVLRELGRLPEAEAAYRQAIAIRPHYPLALNNLASVLKMLGRFGDAEAACRLAVAQRPAFAEACNNLGTILEKLGRLAEAEAAYRQALAIREPFAACHYNLGIVLHAQNRLADAEASYRRALELRPDDVKTLNNLGSVLQAGGRAAEAIAVYRRALACRADLPETWYNLGTMLKWLDRLDESEAAYRQAVALRVDYAEAQFGLATLLLSLGRFEEAWPLYESRYAMPGFVHHRSVSILRCPRWRGEALDGRSLLVWQEDGLGDMIQFGRYLAQLKARGVARLTVACMPALHRLLGSVAGVDEVLDHDAAQARALTFDCWTSLLGVPLHLRGEATVPAVYLRPDAALVEAWRARLEALAPGRRVGLVWKGNPRHHNDANRSLPSLAALAPLWNVAGVRFVSLQKGQGEHEAQSPPAGQPLLHLGSDAADLADTAAIVAQLDLVICVDTSVAHLAASLGTPCWVMLPAHDVDWRWMHGREDSPWYPGGRLFRQAGEGGAWAGLVGRVGRALGEWVSAR